MPYSSHGVCCTHGVSSFFIGCPWLHRRPFLKHPRRTIHGGIFNRNSDHPNLPPLLAKRIPKRPMRGSPRVQLPIRLVVLCIIAGLVGVFLVLLAVRFAGGVD